MAVAVPTSQGAHNVRSRYEPMTSGHAEALVPMIESVMAEAGLVPEDLDRLAFTSGPGTFTGTRICVATARALALARDVELVAVSSLWAIATYAITRIPDCGHDSDAVLIARDARRDEYYAEVVDTDGRSLTGPRLLSADQAAYLCPGYRLFVIGSGADAVMAAAKAVGREVADGRNDQLKPDHLEPDAHFFIGWAASAEPLQSPPVPHYLRAADAKPSSKPAVRRQTGERGAAADHGVTNLSKDAT